MANEQLETLVVLINQKIKFSGKVKDNPEIITDYIPPLGNNEGYMPLEVFLISLSTCAGGTVASLIRKFKKNIDGLEIKAKGERRETHPTSFEKIYLHFNLKSNDAVDEDIQKAINLSEERFCPVWAMIKNNVEVITSFKIEK